MHPEQQVRDSEIPIREEWVTHSTDYRYRRIF